MADAAYFVRIGWVTSRDGSQSPRYWLDPEARAGGQSDDDLVKIPTPKVGANLAVIAQSGCGKSFMLGRLIEEVMLWTKARCLVFDPNADFRRVHDIAPPTLWTEARYDEASGLGALPHELSRDEFAERWSAVPVSIKTARPGVAVAPYERLHLSWPSLSMELFEEDLEPMLRSALHRCHDFVKSLAEIVSLKEGGDPIDISSLLEFAETRLGSGTANPTNILPDVERMGAKAMLARPRNQIPDWIQRLFGVEKVEGGVSNARVALIVERAQALVRYHVETIQKATKYVRPEIVPFYFGKARSLLRDEIIGRYQSTVVSTPRPASRLEVIDLPSLKDKGAIYVATSGLLSEEWARAKYEWQLALDGSEPDRRTPTFVIVEEAHNLMPSEPEKGAAKLVRDQFRAIAAEGRKYGLFLIVVTQRPDKLDGAVLSECQNKIIMRLDSEAVFESTRKLLGLDGVDPETLSSCRGFLPGRALLVGEWVAEPTIAYVAARRTVEGGRNLDAKHWATPYDESTSGPGS